MRTTRFPRWTLPAAGLILVLAACGTDSETTTEGDETTTTTMADMSDDTMAGMTDDSDLEHEEGDHDDHEDGDAMGDMDHQDGDHAHSAMEWDGGTVPMVTLSVVEDPVSGWNVFANATDYAFAPHNASSAHVPGEGHAHIEVDGHKIARVYGEAFHISSLEPGMHEVSFQLAANTHSNYTYNGEPLRAVAMVDVPVPEGDGHHHHGDHLAWDGAEMPSVSLTIHKDEVGGWNLFTETTGFALTPENASTDHVAGEGHMHIYVNGARLARLYTEAYHIAELPAGDAHIEVRLSSNDHHEYALDGTVVAGSTMITVSDAEGTEASVGADNDSHRPTATIEVVVVDGAGLGGVARAPIELGSTVTIMVESDVADQIHVHGYDVFGDVAAGEVGSVVFIADIPGVFEVEFEGTGTLLVELEVR